LLLGTAQVSPAAEYPGPLPTWRESYFAGDPLRIGNRVQLLIDDYAVEDTFALNRVLGPVEKFPGNPLSVAPVLEWVRSWEPRTVVKAHGEVPVFVDGIRYVVYDPLERLFKGWTMIQLMHKTGQARPEFRKERSTLYLESRDGIAWTRPELDLFLIDGRKTDLVMYAPGQTTELVDVSLDEEATDSSRRFRAVVRAIPPGGTQVGLVAMISPDGRRWRLAPDPVLIPSKTDDGSYSLVRDPARDGWLLYRRPPTAAMGKRFGFYAEPSPTYVSGSRRGSVSMSRDLKTWSHPRGFTILDENDGADTGRILGNSMDIDAIEVIRHGDIFLGSIGLMDNQGLEPQRSHLMWSRDGLDWRRLANRRPLVENGGPGEWDAGGVGRVSIVPDGDRIRIYYRGENIPQKEKRLPRIAQTGLAFVGRDRFVGWQAGIESGLLLTRQFLVEGDRLEINCRAPAGRPGDPAWGAQIRAEILQPAEGNQAAQPYPGFAMEDCDPVPVADELQRTVTWRGSPDLSSLRGRTAYIRFSIRSATLYAFRLGDSRD